MYSYGQATSCQMKVRYSTLVRCRSGKKQNWKQQNQSQPSFHLLVEIIKCSSALVCGLWFKNQISVAAVCIPLKANREDQHEVSASCMPLFCFLYLLTFCSCRLWSLWLLTGRDKLDEWTFPCCCNDSCPMLQSFFTCQCPHFVFDKLFHRD